MITQIHPFQEPNRVVVQDNHIMHFQFPEIILRDRYPIPDIWKLTACANMTIIMNSERFFMKYFAKRYIG
jgi:hypothetical protein